jgi:hypothetical protein
MQVDLHIHDRYQVELKCNYSLPHNCRTSAYELDLYLFAPENLNVNRTTYPKQQFYKDLQSRICLQPPIVPLHQLIDDNTNPLKTLRARIELIAQQPQQKPPPDYEVQVKMFCGLARNAIRDMVLYIQEISHHQDRQHITEIENGWMGEQVLLYRKRVRLFPKRIRHIFTHYSVDGLKDVIRFNVQEFLRKMDNPKKALWVMDEEGLLPVKGTRVYHLNLIVRCHHDEVSSISRYRIVFNRKGLRRIEPVTKP